ncbi:hypothetical protein MMC09_006818 [Bachmanniomyces sp. S44760]|nr:hypothetical protein [Bachmanniomyces sp. S44760]
MSSYATYGGYRTSDRPPRSLAATSTDRGDTEIREMMKVTSLIDQSPSHRNIHTPKTAPLDHHPDQRSHRLGRPDEQSRENGGWRTYLNHPQPRAVWNSFLPSRPQDSNLPTFRHVGQSTMSSSTSIGIPALQSVANAMDFDVLLRPSSSLASGSTNGSVHRQKSDTANTPASSINSDETYLRCSYVNECTLQSPPRKVISNFFGRNKACTLDIPDHVWRCFCRKHYQRCKYRNKCANWPGIQLHLILQHLDNLQRWGGVISFEFALQKCVLSEVNAEIRYEDAFKAAQRQGLPLPAPPSRSCASVKGKEKDEGDINPCDGQAEDEHLEFEGELHDVKKLPVEKKREPPEARWLHPYLGKDKSFSEIRDILSMIRRYCDEETPSEVPGFEILPLIRDDYKAVHSQKDRNTTTGDVATPKKREKKRKAKGTTLPGKRNEGLVSTHPQRADSSGSSKSPSGPSKRVRKGSVATQDKSPIWTPNRVTLRPHRRNNH